MALEEMGMYFRSLNQYQQEPFDLTFNLDSVPTGGEIAMMPVKMSLGYNLARSAWWGSKAIGMNPFSKITNPFNPAHLQWRYRAKSMKGFSARLLEGIGSKVGGVKSWVTGTDPMKGEMAVPWYRRAVYSMEKDNAILKEIAEGKGAPNAIKSMGIGALDRYLLRPYEMHTNMARVHSAFRTAVSADELGEMMLSNLYEASSLRGTKGQKLAMVGKFAPKSPVGFNIQSSQLQHLQSEFLHFKGYDTLGPMAEAAPSPALQDYIYNYNFNALSHKRGFVEGGRKEFLRMSRGNRVSVFDLITGKAEGFEKQVGEGYFRSRWRYAKENINFGYDDDTRKKLSLFHSRSKEARKFYQQYMLAQDKTYQQVAIKAAQQSSDDLARQFKVYTGFMDDVKNNRKIMERQALGAWDKVRNVRWIKRAVGTATGIATAAWLTKSIVQGALTLPGRIASTVRELVRPEFGSGEVLSNSRISTERQRAIQAIQNSHMNARYLLGNEAAMYH